MKVIKPLALGVLHRPIEFQRRFFLGVAAITFCPMGEAPGILGDIAMWKFLAEELPPTQPLDLALPKTAAEFLVTGSAFAPGGGPARAVTVSARLGTLTKRLMAVGDRHIEDGRATEPAAFTEMPMGWERAYGGPKLAENPLGRGTEELPLAGIGYRIPLPNVVEADRGARVGEPQPLGFGPIDIAWPQRSKLAGTYDPRWLQEEFPGFARDIDWRIFMAAAPDQRFPGFLRGDEDYAIENMHRELPELTGRLPGIAPRIFIQRRGTEGLEEVPLGLTTVWFFPNRRRLVMIHHGRVRVAEEDARDVERLLLGADRLGAPRPAAGFAAVLAKRLDPEYGVLEALRDSDLVPAELLLTDPDVEEAKARTAEEGLVHKRMRRRQELEIERDRERVRALGLDPDKYAMPPMPPEEPPPSLEELPARVERILTDAERRRKESEAAAAKQAEIANALAAQHGLTIPPADRKPAGPPVFSAAAKRRDAEALAMALEAEGLDASQIRAVLADPEITGSWDKAEAQLRDTYLASADAQDPAPRLDAAANQALHARLFDGQRSAVRLDLCGADLAGADLAGFDLTEAWLDGADLTGANLTRAKLGRAVLAHARMDGARLAGAQMAEANLGRASLQGADLSGALLRDAVLRGTDLRKASLRRADLSGAQLDETPLEGADFSDVTAPKLMLRDSALAGMRAIGALLDEALFYNVDLAGADLSATSLHRATFIKARAAGIVFSTANLARAVFVESDLTGATLDNARCEGTNFRGTRLAGATFRGTLLDGADLSDCDLAGASFDLARAREARFVAANLNGATMTRADFMGVNLGRADLRGANLSDSSLYEADLGRIQADSATRYDRVQHTRTKLVPRRVPA